MAEDSSNVRTTSPDQNGEPRFQTDNTVSKKPQPKQQLSKSMEHMRFAVTVNPVPHTSTPTPPSPSQPTQTPAENDAYGVPASFAPVRAPSSRSHDPTNNQKRSDPFAFGSRYLEEGDNIFEFNAWDHVSVDDTYKAFSEEQYSRQRQDPVSDFDRKRFNDNPEKWWNVFYKNNKTNFFKNRKWLAQEFPILSEVGKPDAPPAVLLEVGAGAGNSAFPILQSSQNPKLKIHACDFSKKAVELIRSHELYNPEFIQADVWDVASAPDSENAGLPPGLTENSVDVVLMIFIFSALNPRQWDQAVRNIWRVLKPGGQVLFRDYGRGDLAQVRFKKGRWMEANFYVRGDGTRVYFFEQEELENIWGGKPLPSKTKNEEVEERNDADGELAEKTEELDLNDSTELPSTQGPRPAFEVAHIGVDRRMLVNRQRRLKMYRCWMQAVFRKAGDDSQVATSTLRQDKQGEGEEAAEED
ncbi:methyltransferase [Setomelanomma holmii]|uniref:Methyltransferase n=1 Tax=Setomelanomma holmii TaxID=210430 RepID=A0A9P4HKN0_9PLEO|nr:methyltransferase [Setomelanomma holmii]